MSDITVTQNQIDSIFEQADKRIETVFGKCTVMAVQLKNGFIIVESTACVDPENYSEEIGIDICTEKIKNKLWELEGYLLQNKGEMK